ncbi:MAG: NADH-quinone oxidoreductase subunit J [Planctomycetota bacterium]|jgi:NADH-quinone oxidoreductase subunit J
MEGIPLVAATGGHAVAFYVLSALAVGSAILMLVQKNPVASVLWLVLCFVGLAGLFVNLEAYFIAVIQILVYAGAIMVLFLFVIMLLDLRSEELDALKLPRIPLVGLAAAVLFLVAMVAVVAASKAWFGKPMGDYLVGQSGLGDSVKAVGLPLFKEWLLPFEVTSVLLLAAIVGAVALTKRKL